MNKSNRQLCSEFHLDWEQNPIKNLGVIFTPEVFVMLGSTMHQIFYKNVKYFSRMVKTKLILQGKITIIKSVALSKCVHLFLSLPNPPGNLIQTLNKLLCKILWNTGTDRIKRNYIVKTYIKRRIESDKN